MKQDWRRLIELGWALCPVKDPQSSRNKPNSTRYSQQNTLFTSHCRSSKTQNLSNTAPQSILLVRLSDRYGALYINHAHGIRIKVELSMRTQCDQHLTLCSLIKSQSLTQSHTVSVCLKQKRIFWFNRLSSSHRLNTSQSWYQLVSDTKISLKRFFSSLS